MKLKLNLLKPFLMALMMITITLSSAQDTAKTEEEIFIYVEQLPQFPGGESALMKFLGEQIQYPATAIDDGIHGKVIVQFVVDTAGEIEQVEILKGVRDDLNKEAIRVIKLMPKWIPGRQRNKPVSVRYRLPVSFVLENDEPAKKKSRKSQDD
jgi:protein TonB